MKHGPGAGTPEDYEPPKWYVKLRACDRLHVSILEYEQIPQVWINRALAADRVESEAQAWRNEHPNGYESGGWINERGG